MQGLDDIQSKLLRIEAVEQELIEVGDRLDLPFTSRGQADDIAMALGHRARALHRAYAHLANDGQFIAARTLLRPAVETNILLRFIRRHAPEQRARLWHAEGKRQQIELVEQLRRHPPPAQHKLAPLPSDEELVEVRRWIAAERNVARQAGI